MSQKQIQAKPGDPTDKEEGQKFASLQPPDISEALKVGQEMKKKTKRYKCGICGAKGSGGCSPVEY